MREGPQLSSLDSPSANPLGADSFALGLTALGEWDSPALSNALERLDIRPRNTGFSDASIALITGARLCGVAVTAKLRARQSGDDGVPVAELWRAINAADGPVVVVIEDVDDPPGGGAFLGEVTGNLLAAQRVAGVVTNGRVRDAGDLRALGLTVFAAGLCVSRSYVRLVEVNGPVVVGGLAVAPGDVVHGDEHGLLQIPRSAVAELPEIATQLRVAEQQTVAWTRSPEFSYEALLARQPPK